NGALTSRWVVSANYSNFTNNFNEVPQFNGYQISDITPSQEKTGVNITYAGLGLLQNTYSHVHQFGLSSSHTLSLFGGHTFEYGYQFEDVVYDISNLYSGGDFTLPTLAALGAASGKVMHGASVNRTHEIASDPTSPIVLQVTRGNYSAPSVNTLTRY